MQKGEKNTKICIFQKKVVPLHAFCIFIQKYINKNKIYRSKKKERGEPRKSKDIKRCEYYNI